MRMDLTKHVIGGLNISPKVRAKRGRLCSVHAFDDLTEAHTFAKKSRRFGWRARTFNRHVNVDTVGVEMYVVVVRESTADAAKGGHS